ncbi:MAG: SMC-Scp complex subunit ScpB [Kofleriaceae bacterium]
MSRKRKKAREVEAPVAEAVVEEILAEGSGPIVSDEVLAEAAAAAESDDAHAEPLMPEAILEAVAEADAGNDAVDGEVLEGDAVEGGGDGEGDGEVDGEGAALPIAAVAMEGAELKKLVEALVFASDKPVTVQRLRQLTRVADTKRLEATLLELQADYSERGLILTSVSGGWQFRTQPRFSTWVQQLIAGRPVRLSRAQLETLAIIAYRQPITRPEIDDIRGVDSSATLKLLLDRQLIRILGKKEEVGRPMLYGTTKEFLDFFSLGDLRELPTLREYSELTDESRRVMTDRLGISPDEADAAASDAAASNVAASDAAASDADLSDAADAAPGDGAPGEGAGDLVHEHIHDHEVHTESAIEATEAAVDAVADAVEAVADAVEAVADAAEATALEVADATIAVEDAAEATGPDLAADADPDADLAADANTLSSLAERILAEDAARDSDPHIDVDAMPGIRAGSDDSIEDDSLAGGPTITDDIVDSDDPDAADFDKSE